MEPKHGNALGKINVRRKVRNQVETERAGKMGFPTSNQVLRVVDGHENYIITQCQPQLKFANQARAKWQNFLTMGGRARW